VRLRTGCVLVRLTYCVPRPVLRLQGPLGMHLAPNSPEIWAVSSTETDFEGLSSFSDIAKRVRGISGRNRGADLGEPNGAF
jgi:hypothetical protein